jgi:MscS family membrane protein
VVKLDIPIKEFSKKFGKELHQEIGIFISKSLKLFIVILGVVAILQVWGINVSAFLASLGLGGLAFALAAKDTAANLFGGLTILADKALKIGDWIKVGSVEGIVEDIGLRTTKVRTFEKSLITLPNQMLANQPVENFSKRGIRRIKCRIGLTYSTPGNIVETIANEIREMLQNHDSISKEATTLVQFDLFADSSLSIFVYTFTNTSDWEQYLQIRQDVNLKIIDIVHKNGSDFAFPTQTIFIDKGEE